MGSGLFLADLLSGHEPGRSAAIPGRSNVREPARLAAGADACTPKGRFLGSTYGRLLGCIKLRFSERGRPVNTGQAKRERGGSAGPGVSE